MSNMKVVFDTLQYASTLKNGGVPEAQAKVHTDALVAAMSQGVATHEDIVELKGEIAELRNELKGEIAEFKNEIDKRFVNVNWMLAITLAVVVLTNPVALHVFKVIGLAR